MSKRSRERKRERKARNEARSIKREQEKLRKRAFKQSKSEENEASLKALRLRRDLAESRFYKNDDSTESLSQQSDIADENHLRSIERSNYIKESKNEQFNELSKPEQRSLVRDKHTRDRYSRYGEDRKNDSSRYGRMIKDKNEKVIEDKKASVEKIKWYKDNYKNNPDRLAEMRRVGTLDAYNSLRKLDLDLKSNPKMNTDKSIAEMVEKFNKTGGKFTLTNINKVKNGFDLMLTNKQTGEEQVKNVSNEHLEVVSSLTGLSRQQAKQAKEEARFADEAQMKKFSDDNAIFRKRQEDETAKVELELEQDEREKEATKAALLLKKAKLEDKWGGADSFEMKIYKKQLAELKADENKVTNRKRYSNVESKAKRNKQDFFKAQDKARTLSDLGNMKLDKETLAKEIAKEQKRYSKNDASNDAEFNKWISNPKNKKFYEKESKNPSLRGKSKYEMMRLISKRMKGMSK